MSHLVFVLLSVQLVIWFTYTITVVDDEDKTMTLQHRTISFWMVLNAMNEDKERV